MGEGTGGVDRLPSPLGRGVGGEGVQLLSVNQSKISSPGENSRRYPYLFRGKAIERPNHVWSTDITYIPLDKGFIYLVAVIDWYSRYVLSWEVSSALDVHFCLDVLESALSQGMPEIFNTDQGSQFTSLAFKEG